MERTVDLAPHRVTGRLVFGIVVLAAGVLFLLDNLDLADAGRFLRWLPALPLAWGLVLLTGVGGRRNVGAGVLVSAVSGWFLLVALGWIRGNPMALWPVVLVIVGGWIVVAALRGPATQARLEDRASSVHAFAMWSGTERKVAAPDFRGGEVTAIMGGHEIDLRQAGMAPGASAVLDLFVWWGGVVIRVPRDWRVTSEAMPLMGGIEDTTDPPQGEARGHLVLKGPVIMGGVEIKN